MCNTAPNNVVAANVGKDVTVIYQADGKRAHIPSVRNDGIVVIAGKVTINIAVVIRAVDVESVLRGTEIENMHFFEKTFSTN